MVKRKTQKTKPKSKTKTKNSSKEKIVGKVEHTFDKINVITTTLKTPLKVGDVIRIKGATTDFLQEVDSIQINHKTVLKAKKGDGIGIKVSGKVRDNDMIFTPSKKVIEEFKRNNISSKQILTRPALSEKETILERENKAPNFFSF